MLLPQVLRGCSLMLCMIPINNIALGTLPPARMKNASGLYNLTRNLGGAVGLALINTVLNDRWDLHLARLHERFTWTNNTVLERLDMTRRQFDALGLDGNAMALKAMMNTVRMQGLVMGFTDVFLVLTLPVPRHGLRDSVDPPAACRRAQREAGIDAVVIAGP